MEGLKVMCRSCGCVDLYQTTKTYDPKKRLTGDMLSLQKPYDSFNWEVYEGAMADKSTPRFLMFCTRCGGYITTDGKLAFADPSFDIHKAMAERDYDQYDPEIPDVEESDELKEWIGEIDELDKKQQEQDKPLKAEYAEQTMSPDNIHLSQFVCPIPGCGKVCASKAGLAAHIRLAHKER